MTSLLALQRRADAALHHQIVIAETKLKDQPCRTRDCDTVMPRHSPTHQASYSKTPSKCSEKGLSSLSRGKTIEGDDNMEQLLRDVVFLAASHQLGNEEASLPKSLACHDNAYMEAMITAYQLYGEEVNWMDADEGLSSSLCFPSDAASPKQLFTHADSIFVDEDAVDIVRVGNGQEEVTMTPPQRHSDVQDLLTSHALQTASGISPSARRVLYSKRMGRGSRK